MLFYAYLYSLLTLTPFFLCAVRYGGAELIELVDSVQPNMWTMVVDRLISLETQKVG